jgi:hypothetical protein
MITSACPRRAIRHTKDICWLVTRDWCKVGVPRSAIHVRHPSLKDLAQAIQTLPNHYTYGKPQSNSNIQANAQANAQADTQADTQALPTTSYMSLSILNVYAMCLIFVGPLARYRLHGLSGISPICLHTATIAKLCLIRNSLRKVRPMSSYFWGPRFI